MAVLDKYKLLTSPPKITKARAAKNPMEKVNRNFLAGLKKQLKKAKAWRPGAKDLRSWVTRDEAKGQAYVTVKYGPWPIAIRGTKKSTIGPVKLDDVPKILEDVKKAFEAGELEAGLRKVAFRGPRKKTRKKRGQRAKKAA
jgi:hypothetical protein